MLSIRRHWHYNQYIVRRYRPETIQIVQRGRGALSLKKNTEGGDNKWNKSIPYFNDIFSLTTQYLTAAVITKYMHNIVYVYTHTHNIYIINIYHRQIYGNIFYYQRMLFGNSEKFVLWITLILLTILSIQFQYIIRV